MLPGGVHTNRNASSAAPESRLGGGHHPQDVGRHALPQLDEHHVLIAEDGDTLGVLRGNVTTWNVGASLFGFPFSDLFTSIFTGP